MAMQGAFSRTTYRHNSYHDTASLPCAIEQDMLHEMREAVHLPARSSIRFTLSTMTQSVRMHRHHYLGRVSGKSLEP
jgi:hypothetical protein